MAVVAAKASKRRALGSHLARLGAQVTLYASIEAVRQRTIAGATTTAVEPDAIVVDASSRADYPLVAAALALPRNAANAKLFIIAPIGSDMHIASASDIPDTLVISRPSLRAEVISALATPPAADGQAELQTTPTANGYGNGNGSSDQLHGLSILVAEDNPVNQEIVREDLIALGCDDLVVVENGIEALAACEQRTFDIILMDCQMPKMDGLRATREIRSLETRDGRRQTPIIAVTANAFSSDRQDCSDSGMTGFLCKPFRQSDLSTALREAIEFRRTSRRDAAGVKLDTKRPASQTGDAPLATAMAS